MKKFILGLACTLLLVSCGVGNYTVSSGMADSAAISITSTAKTPAELYIDGKLYNVETVWTKRYKKDRKIKETALNTVEVEPGQHDVRIVINGSEVYKAKVFLSNTEHRVIEL